MKSVSKAAIYRSSSAFPLFPESWFRLLFAVRAFGKRGETQIYDTWRATARKSHLRIVAGLTSNTNCPEVRRDALQTEGTPPLPSVLPLLSAAGVFRLGTVYAHHRWAGGWGVVWPPKGNKDSGKRCVNTGSRFLWAVFTSSRSAYLES